MCDVLPLESDEETTVFRGPGEKCQNIKADKRTLFLFFFTS